MQLNLHIWVDNTGGRGMLVKDVMTRNPVTVTPETSVTEAKNLMTRSKVGKLPVVDKNGTLVGIITGSDLVKATPSDATTLDMFELSYLLSKLTVEKVMHKDVKVVGEDETIEEAALLMADYSISSLPVITNNLVVGIITEGDLFKAFIDMFGTRYAGVRATFVMGDIPGALNQVTQRLAQIQCNIVSLVTADLLNSSERKVTLKVTDITPQQLEKVLCECGAKLLDMRTV